jgi:hypothetical protein
MGLYKLEKDKFEEIEKTEVRVEKDLENLLEIDPKPILDGEDLLIIGRQAHKIDLLALDRNGNTVIIEFKKDESPRDVIAQILEYTAWVSKIGYDGLNDLYAGYGKRKNEDLHSAFTEFLSLSDEETLSKADYNSRQRIVIFAGTVEDDIIEVTKYLRENGNIDIYCIEYNSYKSATGEEIINTEVRVGAESIGSRSSAPEVLTKERFIDKISNREVKEVAKEFFNYLEGLSMLNVRPFQTQISVYLNNKKWLAAKPWSNYFRIWVKADFDNKDIELYSGLTDFKDDRRKYGVVTFILDSQTALDKFCELAEAHYKRLKPNE